MFDRPLYVDRIMAFVDAPFIKILTGVRRCGSRAMTAGDRQYVADDRIETAEHRQRLGIVG